MSEDAQESLETYKLQLQQVEAALTNDPDNDDLLKLQKDLQEVIELTQELANAQASKTSSTKHEVSKEPVRDWEVGEKCMALWTENGQYYEATIEEISEKDGNCIVTFLQYGSTDTNQLSQLRPVEASSEDSGRPQKRSADHDDTDVLPSKKEQQEAEREWKRKKAQKKATRLKTLEEAREVEKNKWQNFNSKAFSKNKKGHVKRSIFASPDNVQGRVGVGTCGIGGKPMTEYQHQEKWKKAQGGGGGGGGGHSSTQLP